MRIIRGRTQIRKAAGSVSRVGPCRGRHHRQHHAGRVGGIADILSDVRQLIGAHIHTFETRVEPLQFDVIQHRHAIDGQTLTEPGSQMRPWSDQQLGDGPATKVGTLILPSFSNGERAVVGKARLAQTGDGVEEVREHGRNAGGRAGDGLRVGDAQHHPPTPGSDCAASVLATAIQPPAESTPMSR